jgi:hypothetical protein
MTGIGGKEEQARLYKYIDGVGGADMYVDAEEERGVFEKATELNIWQGQAEAMLNHRCKKHRWTRETEVTYYLRIMLEEATKDDGVIDKQEFDHIIGFAVAVRVPRKDALAICCKMVREAGWKTKAAGMFSKKDWLTDYEQGKER